MVLFGVPVRFGALCDDIQCRNRCVAVQCTSPLSHYLYHLCMGIIVGRAPPTINPSFTVFSINMSDFEVNVYGRKKKVLYLLK